MGSISKIDQSPENFSPLIINPLDPEEFRRQGYMVIDLLADYYKTIEKHPVRSQVEPGYLQELLPKSAPYSPEPVETILQDVKEHIIPGITHWQSPNFFAYFPAGCSTAGFLGEMLISGLNVVGFHWMSSPAATELENVVMDWLGEMLQLPKSFLFSGDGGGVIHGTTCEAILCTLVAARDQMLGRIGRENIGKLVVYGSDQTHCTVQKASRIAGIHPENFRVIGTRKSTSFAMSADSLSSAICSDIEAGLVPLFLCATIGTTSTTAVDPLRPLCEVATRYGLWVHVDAAYAGSACICPEFRRFMDGVERADSFSLNAHKWLFTPLDCCCLWLRDPKALRKSLSTLEAEYLKNKATDSKQVVDYKDWQLSLSRRFRSLKLWLVLRSYGVENLRKFMRNQVRMATMFEELVATDKRFETVVPRNFALVCFRALPSAAAAEDDKEKDANELNRELLESINDSGKLYMTHSMVGGVYLLRFAVAATLTEDRHVIAAWKVIQEHADVILAARAVNPGTVP